jgi:hypothetical protein
MSLSFAAASTGPNCRLVRHLHGEIRDIPKILDPAPDVVVHMWAMTEKDAESLVGTFSGANRAVVISSGDVHRAYGRLVGLEPGPSDPIPLAEDLPLRESRYPYLKTAPNISNRAISIAFARAAPRMY